MYLSFGRLDNKSWHEDPSIDMYQLFVDVFYIFLHSSKKTQQFAYNWHSLFSSEPTTILKHCTTRWLSLLRCVNRFIDQFDVLKSYFLSCEEAETVKVKIPLILYTILSQGQFFNFSHTYFHPCINSTKFFRSQKRIPLVNCSRR